MKFFLVVIFILLFTSGCTPKKESVENFFQTQSAVTIKKDYQKIIKYLINFKDKLDKRNPNLYNQDFSHTIYNQMSNYKNNLYLKYNNKRLYNYQEYLNIAFSNQRIQNRSDFLILGMFKAIYEAYDLSTEHKFIAYSYNQEKLQKLHYNLQVLRWKIRFAKDIDGNYLFLTWQNNWQIELENLLKTNDHVTYEDIRDLPSIKDKQESVFDSSNMSYQVILSQMISCVENSLTYLGVDATELSLEALKTIILFI